MRIQVFSDLHQEFGFADIPFSDVDVIVFAGDVNLGVKGIQWIQSVISAIPVIYVLGNHEYYKGSYPKTLNKIVELAEGTNVHVLENKAVTLHGVTFHGATLWTDFELFGNGRTTGMLCQDRMNDYKMIRRDPSYSRLRSVDTYTMHRSSVKWLTGSLDTAVASKNIVVTHHAPSIQSLPEKYREDIVSAAYASNLEDLILKYQPAYWIHGHIHEPKMYKVGATTVLCNPHGYINEPYCGFDPNLIIEV